MQFFVLTNSCIALAELSDTSVPVFLIPCGSFGINGQLLLLGQSNSTVGIWVLNHKRSKLLDGCCWFSYCIPCMRKDPAWSHLWWHWFLKWLGFLIRKPGKDWMIDWSTLSCATLLCASNSSEKFIEFSSNQFVRIFYGRTIFGSVKFLQNGLYICIYIHHAKSDNHCVELNFLTRCETLV